MTPVDPETADEIRRRSAAGSLSRTLAREFRLDRTDIALVLQTAPPIAPTALSTTPTPSTPTTKRIRKRTRLGPPTDEETARILLRVALDHWARTPACDGETYAINRTCECQRSEVYLCRNCRVLLVVRDYTATACAHSTAVRAAIAETRGQEPE